MADRKFEIGDVVQLKSGGPLMTVHAITTNLDGAPAVATTWFDSNETERQGNYLEAVLLKAEAEVEEETDIED